MGYIQHRVPCCRTKWEQNHNSHGQNPINPDSGGNDPINPDSGSNTHLIITYEVDDTSSPITLFNTI